MIYTSSKNLALLKYVEILEIEQASTISELHKFGFGEILELKQAYNISEFHKFGFGFGAGGARRGER